MFDRVRYTVMQQAANKRSNNLNIPSFNVSMNSDNARNTFVENSMINLLIRRRWAMNVCPIGRNILLLCGILLAAAQERSDYLVDESSKDNLQNVINSTDIPQQVVEMDVSNVKQHAKQLESRKAWIGNGVEEDSSEEDEERGLDDSSVEDEMKSNDETTWTLSPVQLDGPLNPQESQKDAVYIIYNSFINRKTFSCPKIKNDFVTGTDTGDLSPEDIRIIAAMGDSLATGKGLWPQTDIEFRGAAFPIGGDATIDGLVTIANILHEFNDKLVGVSHGMGTKWQLPDYQLNVAEDGASSSSMPLQAEELVRRLNALREVDVHNEWTMVIITVGTEEVCKFCKPPDYGALLQSLLILNRGIRKAFVVLLGPIHVSSSYRQEANLLKSRCGCSKEKSDEFIKELSRNWTVTFNRLQAYFEEPHIKRREFGLLALPMLTITSRYPDSLFIPNRPLLNRKGHAYATKWLWNRLMTGPTYNLSLAVLSHDSYYCPSMGCPYFRTIANRQYCRLLRHIDADINSEDIVLGNNRPVRRSRQKLYATAATVVLICFITVLVVSIMLYQKRKYELRVRYGKNLRLEYRDMEENSFSGND